MKQLDFARQLRSTKTDTENLLWSHLHAHRSSGLKFRRQQPIGKYVVDFLCPEKKLIVELDGGQHQERINYDQERDTWLQAEGYTLLRYWNNDVMGYVEGVLEDIGRVAGVFAEASPSTEGASQSTGPLKYSGQFAGYPQPLSPQGRGVSTAHFGNGEDSNNSQTGLSPLSLAPRDTVAAGHMGGRDGGYRRLGALSEGGATP